MGLFSWPTLRLALEDPRNSYIQHGLAANWEEAVISSVTEVSTKLRIVAIGINQADLTNVVSRSK